ncbi:MAG: hypothetical protein JRF30_03025 [Deltaproteobacteria bacterium]|nr:hypothetical protein [Deltaproteobacteria bacterium]MBW2329908.1 hypothetical protein [Deltaproteobacteria bacterium]
MALLAEYALTPDVFDAESYSSGEVGDIHLQHLKEAILHEALVRNLRHGRWLHVFSDNDRAWHQRGRELLRKLVTQNRLNCFQPVLTDEPTTDDGWCSEAIASHEVVPLAGVVVTSDPANKFNNVDLVSAIGNLRNANWWRQRSPSVRLSRNLADYQEHLRLVLRCANSIMFIDPHLDPTQPRYSHFVNLLLAMEGRSPRPLIEIHRVCYVGSGPKRQIIPQAELEQWFKQKLTDPLRDAGLEAHIFVWDDFHDRYLISNLVGVSIPYGFDTTRQPGSITTWTRLGRADRDDIQREFDPASNRHTLRYSFIVPQ